MRSQPSRHILFQEEGITCADLHRLKEAGGFGGSNFLFIGVKRSNMKERSCPQPKEFELFLKGIQEQNNCMVKLKKQCLPHFRWYLKWSKWCTDVALININVRLSPGESQFDAGRSLIPILYLLIFLFNKVEPSSKCLART